MKTNLNWSEFMELLPQLLPVLLPILIVISVLVITALVNLIKKQVPFTQKIIWLIIILFINIIGPIIYFVIGSRILDENATERNEDEE